MVLLVHPNGSKYWRLRYRFGGKEKMLALGKYPEVSLEDARSRRDDACKLLAIPVTPQVSVSREGGAGTPVPDLSAEVDNFDEVYLCALASGFSIEYVR